MGDSISPLVGSSPGIGNSTWGLFQSFTRLWSETQNYSFLKHAKISNIHLQLIFRGHIRQPLGGGKIGQKYAIIL